VSASVACPSCGHPNPPGSTFCNRCGAQFERLAPPAPGIAVPPPPAGTGTTTTHTGRVYALGYDATSFAIVPLTGDPPVERFERTEDGWGRAWDRFQRLDRRDAAPFWRQRTGLWILMNAVIGFIVWIAILAIAVAALEIAGRETDELTAVAETAIGVALPVTIAGWLLFAYAASRTRRLVALAVLVGGALAGVLVTLFLEQLPA
jgi:hypothetical protein